MKSSNLDEVNRLLAEEDSSSDDDQPQAKQGLNQASGRTLESIVGSAARPTSLTGANSLAKSAHVSQRLPATSARPAQASTAVGRQSLALTSRMNAEEILNAVSSGSDDDDFEVEKLIQEQMKSRRSTLKALEESKSGLQGAAAKAGGVAESGAQEDGVGVSKGSEQQYDFYWKNMKDPSVREKFINDQLDMTDSSDDDALPAGVTKGAQSRSVANNKGVKSGQKVQAQSRLNDAQAQRKVQSTDPVVLVETNERLSQHTPDKMIEQASQLLSFDKEFYNVKKELFTFSHFQNISQMLYEDTHHAYYGVVSCVRMFRAKNGTVIFVGNSAGYIRVFDIQSQRQMKPLYDDALNQCKVLCLDISEDGHYLLAGYKTGILVLWDSSKFKKAHTLMDVAKNRDSDFSQVKLLFQDEKVINIVTAEESGRIRLVHVTKTLFGGFSHKANSLYEADLKGTATISVMRPSNLPSHFSPFCDASCLTAYGATNMITVVEMRRFPPRPIKTIKRPSICKEKSVPSIDWGYGLTPQERERTIPLIAIAWDKIVQLLWVNEATKTLEYDGFYCSDEEINQVHFMADSVLAILVNKEQVKVLYTEKFKPGSFKVFDQERASGEMLINREFKVTVQGTRASELETGHFIKNIRPGLVIYETERIDGSKIENRVTNFNNTVCAYKKNIIFVGTDRIYRARLLSWREFIDKLKFTDNHDWLTVLKVALEIYNGEIKGFALLPDAKERRQSFLKDYMKKLILTSIETVIFKFKTHDAGPSSQSDSTHNDSDESYEENFSIDKIAIKVSIEFCLQINEVAYLFSDIYRFFCEKDLEDKFINLLCAPIIAGQFRSELIPELILQKLVRMYEDRQEFKLLEKLILNVNVAAYHRRSTINATGSSQNPTVQQARGMLSYLEVVCKSHCMVSALLQLQTSQLGTGLQAKQARDGCYQVLSMLLTSMETQKAIADQDELMRQSSAGKGAADKHRRVTKQDILLLANADKTKKYEIEQSAFYIGYKLLWIVGLFLKGKKFPSGELDEAQYRTHVLHIVDFVTDEQTLALLLDLDAKAFFQTMKHLFCGKPWQYLVHQSKEYTFDFQKVGDVRQQLQQILSNPYSSTGDNLEAAQTVMHIFKQAAERTNRKEPGFTRACFNELLLNVVVNQDSEHTTQEKMRMAAQGRSSGAVGGGASKASGQAMLKLEIEYAWIVQALKSALSRQELVSEPLVQQVIQQSSGQGQQVNPDLVIDTLKTIKVQPAHIDEMIELIRPLESPSFTRVRIALFESKEDYVEAFMQHLNNEQLKKGIFKWLIATLEKLVKADRALRHQKAQEETKEKTQKASDSDEEDGKTKVGEAGDEYEPLSRLKKTLKNRILELAQSNSEQTVYLVETYLSEGDFQERLILEQFSRFEDQQLSYLTSYITKNEDAIKKTMQEDFSASHQTAARKYERYLILFTKLLCKLQKNQVDQWVGKSYFPPDKCLPIVKEYQNLKGEAILTLRAGKPVEAIDVYLRLLSNFPIYKMIAQFKLLIKDRPSFLGYTDLAEDVVDKLEKQMSIAPEQRYGGSRPNFVPDSVLEFDAMLGKACSICKVDDLDSDQRMAAWFQILRYLQNYMVDSHNKVSEGLLVAKKVYQDLSLANLKEDDKAQYIKRLKDFVMDRINYILRYPGLDIPLKTIVERLNLTFEQIKQLCGSKLQHSGATLRIEYCQQMIAVGQLMDAFQEGVDKQTNGYVVEPNKRYIENQRGREGRRIIKAQSICNQCMSSIVRNRKRTEPLIIYQCNHQYHSSCLAEKQKEIGNKKCPICLKHSYLAVREEREKLEQRQRKRVGRRPKRHGAQGSTPGTSGQEPETDDEHDSMSASILGSATTAVSEFSMPSAPANLESLMCRKLEQYDTLLDDVSLGLSAFEEAMEIK